MNSQPHQLFEGSSFLASADSATILKQKLKEFKGKRINARWAETVQVRQNTSA